jgi:hypothetical protein
MVSCALVAAALCGCGMSGIKSEKRQDSPDKVDLFSDQAPFDRPSDCRAHIRKAICLVASQESGGLPDNSKPRECLAGGEQYAATFEQLYDSFPRALQQMFCSLQKIHVEKSFYATAYAKTLWIKNPEKGTWATNGGILGIRQSVLDSSIDLAKWASWKEQLPFGGASESYALTENLPTVKTHSQGASNDLLYFVVAHEFGHFFDSANDANAHRCEGDGEQKKCSFLPDTWAAISWEAPLIPKSGHDFPNRDRVCFYDCKQPKIDASLMPTMYNDLATSPFLTMYGATSPYEEFADTYAYVMLSEAFDSSFKFAVPGTESYDVMKKLYSTGYLEKVSFIKNLMRDPYYP